MDSVFGLIGKDFVILAADATSSRSILVFQHDLDKIVSLDTHKIIASSGVAADSSNFLEFIQRNLKLYEFDNDSKLTTNATANYIRNELAIALRKGPYQVNLLLGGYDKNEPSLYFLDYLAALTKVRFGAHGHASNFILSVFDREWKENLTTDEAIDIIHKCINELKTRFLISQPKFIVKLVNKDGTKVIEI
eukprot:gene20243-26280_t